MASEIQNSGPASTQISAVSQSFSVNQGRAQRAESVQPIEKADVVAVDDMETVRAAAAEIDAYLRGSGRELAIAFDESLSRPIVRVFEHETSRLVRQIPNEEVLQVARWIRDTIIEPSRDAAIKGMLLSGNA